MSGIRMYPGDDNLYYPLKYRYATQDNHIVLTHQPQPDLKVTYEIDLNKCLAIEGHGVFKADGTQEKLKVKMEFNDCWMRIETVKPEEDKNVK